MNLNGFQELLNRSPIWLVGLILLAVMVVAALGGRWFRRARERAGAEPDDNDESGYVVSAVLGLLALLMGFTFSLAVDRFEARRSLVLAEANAVGVAYLQSQLLPQPDRDRVSEVLVRYVENRVKLGRAKAADVPPLLAANDAMMVDLWSAASAGFDKIKNLDFSSTYIGSVNDVIQVGTSRKAARTVRVPAAVFAVLLVYLVVTAAVLGYVLHGRRGQRTAVFLMALLTLSLMLILDIDRPVGGAINESQAPMEWLLKRMQTTPTATFDRWRTPEAAAAATIAPSQAVGARP